MYRFTSKCGMVAAVALLALGSVPTGASADAADQLYTGSTGVASPLSNPGNAQLEGKVVPTCMATQEVIGGYSGPVQTSTTKGDQGSGYCPSDYQVTGSVQMVGGPSFVCTPKIVKRPESGWNGNIHYAHFGAVSVDGPNITCAMGGE